MDNFVLSRELYSSLLKAGNDAIVLFLFLLSVANDNGEINLGIRSITKSTRIDCGSIRKLLHFFVISGLIEKRDNGFIILSIEDYMHYVGNSDKSKSKSLQERKTEFSDSIKPYLSKYGRDFLNEFYLYWTQIGRGERKMLFEKQKSFQIPNRLALWRRNKKATTTEQILICNDEKDYTKGLWE